MDLSDQDKEVLKLTAEQLWRKGCHNPQESAVAQAFTQLVNKALAPVPPKAPEVVK